MSKSIPQSRGTLDPEVQRALDEARARDMSPEAKHQQKVSYITGMLKHDSGLTRADVERHLAEKRD